MLLITLDDESREPKYRQIVAQVRQRIEAGVVRPGDRLPSTRRLAGVLGIHRSTVAIAYQELWALGFVDLNPGSLPRVRDRVQVAAATDRTKRGLMDWSRVSSPATNAIWETYRARLERGQAGGPSLVDFSTLDMDRRLFPVDSFRSCLNRVIRQQGSTLLGYGDAAGFPPLREWIARRLHGHGISVTADEILVTSGSQQGLDLVFRMVAAPGKRVALETPTYDFVLPLLRFHGLKSLEVPMCHDGLDLSLLADGIEQERPVLVYTMPSFQNPTGVSTSQAHREQLLSLCEMHHIPILEDSFDEEMKYFGRAVLPIKSMDRHHVVIYSGTFSKVLFPGVRIGWIAAERDCVERLTAIRRFSELSPNLVVQAAMHEFCQMGYYEGHISRMHRVFRKRMRTAIQALRRYIAPEWADWTEPSGGYLIWLQLRPVPFQLPDWNKLFAAHGVKVGLGDHFFPSETADTHLRLSISRLNEEEIVAGVRRLAMALGHLYQK